MQTKQTAGNNATTDVLTMAQYEKIQKKVFPHDLTFHLSNYTEILFFLNQKNVYMERAFKDCLKEQIDLKAKKNESVLIEEFDHQSFSYVIEEMSILEKLHHLITIKFIAMVRIETKNNPDVFCRNYIDQMIDFMQSYDLIEVIEIVSRYKMFLDEMDEGAKNSIEIEESITSIITSFVSILESLNLKK